MAAAHGAEISGSTLLARHAGSLCRPSATRDIRNVHLIHHTKEQEQTMTTGTTVIEHQVRRLLIALPEPYDVARQHYETLVPAIDPAHLQHLDTWEAVLEQVKIDAPHGFMRYATMDMTQTMALSPSHWKATQYLMGNHTIAERMFRHDPSAVLHAPLRTLIYADAEGDTKLAVDQPSLLFASYHNPEIASVGEELDALLAALIDLLDGEVPHQLES
jgi:hypothetical protein